MAPPIETLVLFGASGSHTHERVLPAVASLLRAAPERTLSVIGVGRDERSDAQWRDEIRHTLDAAGATRALVRRATSEAHWLTADPTQLDELAGVLQQLPPHSALHLGLPADITARVVGHLRELGVPSGTVLGFPAPFGTNLRTARALNRQLHGFLPESRVHRIDSRLGQGTVRHLLSLRFANRLLAGIWDSTSISRVDIIDERAIPADPGARFDRTGALLDGVHGHLMQLLGLVAMEPPASLDADTIHTGIGQVLRATNLAGDAAAASRRARYIGGSIGDTPVPAYASGARVDALRDTETLAQLTLSVDTWRWSGVPFTLRSGFALGRTRHEIVLTLRDVPQLPRGFTASKTAPQIRIGIGPDALAIDLLLAGGSESVQISTVPLSTTFPAGEPADGEVMNALLGGDTTLSRRADAVEESWRILAPVLAAWQRGDVPLGQYRAGGTGPSAWR